MKLTTKREKVIRFIAGSPDHYGSASKIAEELFIEIDYLRQKNIKICAALESIYWVTGYKDENDKYVINTCQIDRNLVEEALK